MSNPFVAEVRIFAGNFAPTGWALCDGQLLPISQNTALFSLLGTNYGGDGKSNFGLPDFQGRTPIGPGQGPGLTDRVLGETAGESSVSLIVSEMPAHSHTFNVARDFAEDEYAVGNKYLAATDNVSPIYAPASNLTQMDFNSITVQGGSQPHNNMQPYLVLTFIIAMQGVFPPRS